MIGLEALRPTVVNLELMNHKESTNTSDPQIFYHEENPDWQKHPMRPKI